MEGTGSASDRPDSLIPLGDVPIGTVSVYDGENLSGIGVIRPCRTGFKIGPLFADTADVAERHTPETTLLYQLVTRHWSEFKTDAIRAR